MGRVTKLMRSLLLAGVLLAGGLDAATALEVGEQAPDFLLPATTGGNLSLSQFRGQKLVLLEFYMGDFMPTCVANLSARKADYGKFRDLNVQILAVSGSSGSSALNRGHEHQRSTRRLSAREGRPRCLGGVQRGGGT